MGLSTFRGHFWVHFPMESILKMASQLDPKRPREKLKAPHAGPASVMQITAGFQG